MSIQARYDRFFSTLEVYSDRGFAAGVGFLGGSPHVSKFTYAPEFLRQYEKQNLAQHDHTLIHGFSYDGIFTWLEI